MTDEFAVKVQRLIERLQHCSYHAIEVEIAQKRLAWLRQHEHTASRYERPTPRQAFDLLFFDKMRLARDELPIVSESETEIVWQSINRCPTLDAVQALGL